MKILLLALLLLMVGSWAVAQAPAATAYDSTTRYSVSQLRADLTYVRRALEEVHPALYWYTPKDSLNQAFARAEAALTHPLGEPAFWRQMRQPQPGPAAPVPGALLPGAGIGAGRWRHLLGSL